MPVLPLFDTPADADAWHHVIAPGGYERWHFDAEDESRAIRIIVDFLEGADFNTDYLHRYDRYLRRPTRVQPPQAREYPCVQLSVYEKGRVLSSETTHLRPEEFFASDERPDVRVGANGFRRENDGSLRVEIRQRQWRADLVFRPLVHYAPLQRGLLPGNAPGGEHHWVVAQPLCRVEGFVRVTGTDRSPAEIPIAGRGYHDHHFGTGPLGISVDRRFWGRVLAEDRVFAFHVTQPTSPHLPDNVQLFEGGAEGLRVIPLETWNIDWGRQVRRGVLYPGTIAFGERFRLSNPRLLDSNHDQLRLEYDADGEGAKRTAFCEVIHPQRRVMRRRGS
jgi:carotenoid 1,2-hydratase